MYNLLKERFYGEIISVLSRNSATLVAQECKKLSRRRVIFTSAGVYYKEKIVSRG
jgi:hypothetical protein